MAKIKSECTPEEWAEYLAKRMAYKAKWTAQNRERVRKRARERYARDHERHRAYHREYYAAHREQVLERIRNEPSERRDARNARARRNNSRIDVKARRATLDARPDRVASRRAYARTEAAKKRATIKLEERMTPELRSRRKAASREWWSGFKPEDVERFLREQNNRCAICQREFSEKLKYHADHCHDSNRKRGLLCGHCNRAEGTIRATGLTAIEFGKRLHDYLTNS